MTFNALYPTTDRIVSAARTWFISRLVAKVVDVAPLTIVAETGAHIFYPPLTDFKAKPFTTKATPTIPLATAKITGIRTPPKGIAGIMETETGAHMTVFLTFITYKVFVSRGFVSQTYISAPFFNHSIIQRVFPFWNKYSITRCSWWCKGFLVHHICRVEICPCIIFSPPPKFR